MMRRSLRFDPGIERRKYLESEGPELSCCVLVLPRTSAALKNTPAEEKKAVALSFASICDLGG